MVMSPYCLHEVLQPWCDISSQLRSCTVFPKVMCLEYELDGKEAALQAKLNDFNILGLSWLVGWLGGQIKFSYIYSCELWLKQALVKETSGTSDFIGGDLKKKTTHPFPQKKTKKGIRKWIIDLFCIFLALSFRCNRIHTPSNILKYHFPSFLLRWPCSDWQLNRLRPWFSTQLFLTVGHDLNRFRYQTKGWQSQANQSLKAWTLLHRPFNRSPGNSWYIEIPARQYAEPKSWSRNLVVKVVLPLNTSQLLHNIM